MWGAGVWDYGEQENGLVDCEVQEHGLEDCGEQENGLVDCGVQEHGLEDCVMQENTLVGGTWAPGTTVSGSVWSSLEEGIPR